MTHVTGVQRFLPRGANAAAEVPRAVMHATGCRRSIRAPTALTVSLPSADRTQ